VNPLWPALDFVAADRVEDGPWQMAVDEVLLHARTRPTLRAYAWRQPQITFGFFGNYAEVRSVYPGLPLTRRWTGGGAVEHGNDLTFSLVWPRESGHLPESAMEIYATLHERLQAALLALQVESSLASASVGTAEPATGAFCFQAPVRHDLLQGEAKLAGGALRRTRTAWLYQGSVQMPPLAAHPEPFFQALRAALARSWSHAPLGSAEAESAAILAREKYASSAWREGRFLRRFGISSASDAKTIELKKEEVRAKPAQARQGFREGVHPDR
jgi:lipoate-protein ligase A